MVPCRAQRGKTEEEAGARELSNRPGTGVLGMHPTLIGSLFCFSEPQFPTPLGCGEDRRGEKRLGGHSTNLTDGGDLEDGTRGPCRPHLWQLGPWCYGHPSRPGLVSCAPQGCPVALRRTSLPVVFEGAGTLTPTGTHALLRRAGTYRFCGYPQQGQVMGEG